MITQNPIIGRARKKLAGVYSRTMNGKNIIQSCPPPTKGKQTQSQIAVCNSFALLAKMGYQVDASVLNSIYYEKPIGRTRRSEWIKQLATGMQMQDGKRQMQPEAIMQLGSNPKVSEQAFVFTPTSSSLEINFSDLSKVGNAIDTMKPCLILICKDTNQCISLLDYTNLGNSKIILQNLSPTYRNKECHLFPLWAVNVGTINNPILAWGSYQKNI